MKLDKRLNKIASLIKQDATLVDIGCDHGYLAIYLALNNRINYAYASDINQGPLDNVRKNVERYNVNDKISCILSNGLQEFKTITFDTIVIAGMGGSLIVEILENQFDLLEDKHLILQPNINSYGLRKWLIKNNFLIVNELLVEENDIIYEIIEVNTSLKSIAYSELELLFGAHNLMKNTVELYSKMKNYLNKMEKIIENLPKNNEKYDAYVERINLIKEYLLNENK